jgi:hypothetical protein
MAADDEQLGVLYGVAKMQQEATEETVLGLRNSSRALEAAASSLKTASEALPPAIERQIRAAVENSAKAISAVAARASVNALATASEQERSALRAAAADAARIRDRLSKTAGAACWWVAASAAFAAITNASVAAVALIGKGPETNALAAKYGLVLFEENGTLVVATPQGFASQNRCGAYYCARSAAPPRSTSH